jgi:peptidoglycan/LPS O-acetylase OafA/YrhL
MHIAIGHFLIPLDLDLMGGASMGLFYSLSGFVLVLGHGNTIKPMGLKTFLFKRWVRVGPLYLLSNAASAWQLRAAWNSALSMQAALTLTFLTSWCTAFTSSELAIEPFNGVTWSSSTMFWFYVAFPFILPRLQRAQPEALRGLMLSMYGLQAALTIAAFALTGQYSFARMFPPFRLPVFVMGCCAALERLHESRAHSALRMKQAAPRPLPASAFMNATKLLLLWVSLMFLAVLGSKILSWAGLADQWWESYRLGLEVGFPTLFYHLLRALTFEPTLEQDAAAVPAVIHLLRSGAFEWMGEVSMCFFVVHELCQEFAYAQAAAAGWIPAVDIHGDAEASNGREWQPSLGARLLVGVAAPLGLSLALGWVLTRSVEKPLTRHLLRLRQMTHERDGKRTVDNTFVSRFVPNNEMMHRHTTPALPLGRIRGRLLTSDVNTGVVLRLTC